MDTDATLTDLNQPLSLKSLRQGIEMTVWSSLDSKSAQRVIQNLHPLLENLVDDKHEKRKCEFPRHQQRRRQLKRHAQAVRLAPISDLLHNINVQFQRQPTANSLAGVRGELGAAFNPMNCAGCVHSYRGGNFWSEKKPDEHECNHRSDADVKALRERIPAVDTKFAQSNLHQTESCRLPKTMSDAPLDAAAHCGNSSSVRSKIGKHQDQIALCSMHGVPSVGSKSIESSSTSDGSKIKTDVTSLKSSFSDSTIGRKSRLMSLDHANKLDLLADTAVRRTATCIAKGDGVIDAAYHLYRTNIATGAVANDPEVLTKLASVSGSELKLPHLATHLLNSESKKRISDEIAGSSVNSVQRGTHQYQRSSQPVYDSETAMAFIRLVKAERKNPKFASFWSWGVNSAINGATGAGVEDNHILTEDPIEADRILRREKAKQKRIEKVKRMQKLFHEQRLGEEVVGEGAGNYDSSRCVVSDSVDAITGDRVAAIIRSSSFAEDDIGDDDNDDENEEQVYARIAKRISRSIAVSGGISRDGQEKSVPNPTDLERDLTEADFLAVSKYFSAFDEEDDMKDMKDMKSIKSSGSIHNNPYKHTENLGAHLSSLAAASSPLSVASTSIGSPGIRRNADFGVRFFPRISDDLTSDDSDDADGIAHRKQRKRIAAKLTNPTSSPGRGNTACSPLVSSKIASGNPVMAHGKSPIWSLNESYRNRNCDSPPLDDLFVGGVDGLLNWTKGLDADVL